MCVRFYTNSSTGQNFSWREQAVQYNYRLCKWTPSFVHSSVLEFILNKRFFYFSEGKYFKPKLMHFQRSGLDFEGFREILKIPFPSSSIRSVLKVQQKKPVIHVPPPSLCSKERGGGNSPLYVFSAVKEGGKIYPCLNLKKTWI